MPVVVVTGEPLLWLGHELQSGDRFEVSVEDADRLTAAGYVSAEVSAKAGAHVADARPRKPRGKAKPAPEGL